MKHSEKCSHCFYWILLISLVEGFFGGAFAEAGPSSSIPGSRYVSARAAGMGNAFLPLVDDGANALMVNPAQIGALRGFSAELMNLQLAANSDFINELSIHSLKATNLSKYASLIHDNVMPEIGFSYFPNFSSRGFAVGALIQSRISAERDSGGSSIHYRSLYQIIPTAGVGYQFFSGILRLGYSLQYVNEASGERTVPMTTTPLGYNEGLASGAALSHNFGASITLPFTHLPSINVVARNVMKAKFGAFSPFNLARNSSGTPATQPMTFDASYGMVFKHGQGWMTNIVLEEKDLTRTSGYSLLKRSSVGLELTFRGFFSVRGGLNSMYPTAGLGLRNNKSQFDVCWTSEEIGTSSAHVRDARFLLQYQVRAF